MSTMRKKTKGRSKKRQTLKLQKHKQKSNHVSLTKTTKEQHNGRTDNTTSEHIQFQIDQKKQLEDIKRRNDSRKQQQKFQQEKQRQELVFQPSQLQTIRNNPSLINKHKGALASAFVHSLHQSDYDYQINKRIKAQHEQQAALARKKRKYIKSQPTQAKSTNRYAVFSDSESDDEAETSTTATNKRARLENDADCSTCDGFKLTQATFKSYDTLIADEEDNGHLSHGANFKFDDKFVFKPASFRVSTTTTTATAAVVESTSSTVDIDVDEL